MILGVLFTELGVCVLWQIDGMILYDGIHPGTDAAFILSWCPRSFYTNYNQFNPISIEHGLVFVA